MRWRRLQLGLQRHTTERNLEDLAPEQSSSDSLVSDSLWIDLYLQQLQHAQGEGLVAEGAVGHHLDEDRQGTRQLSHGKHHLVGR